MALSREEWTDITRHLQEQVRQADPEVFELLAQHVERWNEPDRYLVAYIEALIKVMSERSGGSHGRVLNELNTWIRTEDDGPIRGIRLALTGNERELYQREHVDLASLPDRSAFIAELRQLRDDLLREIDQAGGGGDRPRG
jgi:hypothetical protein